MAEQEATADDVVNWITNIDENKFKLLNDFLVSNANDHDDTLRSVIEKLTIQGIIEGAIGDNPRHALPYCCFIAASMHLPELAKRISQSFQFWKRLTSVLPGTNIAVAFLITRHACERVKSKYLKNLIKSGILQELLLIREDSNLFEDHFDEIVAALLFQFRGNDEIFATFRKCGILRKTHLLQNPMTALMVSDQDAAKQFYGSQAEGSSYRDWVGMNDIFGENVLGGNLGWQEEPKAKPLKCANCGAEDEGKNLKMCGRCKSVFYCNRKCSKAHWKKHKKSCKQFVKEKNQKTVA